MIPVRHSAKSLAALILVALIAFLLSACAAKRPYELKHAEAELAEAKSDTFIVSNAPLLLNEAERTYLKADETWRKTKDDETVIPLAQLAQEQIETARLHAGKAAVVEQGEAQQRAMMQAEAALKTNRILLQELRRMSQDQLMQRNIVSLNSDLLFEVDDATLTAGGKQDLQQVADFLRTHTNYNAVVEGHTDSTADAAYNRRLSDQRARAVGEYLRSQGVSSTRIRAIGQDEEYPIASNDTAAGRLQNRRVEIIITPQLN